MAGSLEINKTRHEKRVLRCREVTAEEVSFPFARQVALIHRELGKHQPETVALITSLPRSELDAGAWLKDNRQHWGIENGLHLRLDVSHNDDQSRCRTRPSIHVMGMFRRLSNSLCCHWRTQFDKPQYKTTTDFFTAMATNHCRPAIRIVNAAKPRLPIAP